MMYRLKICLPRAFGVGATTRLGERTTDELRLGPISVSCVAAGSQARGPKSKGNQLGALLSESFLGALRSYVKPVISRLFGLAQYYKL